MDIELAHGSLKMPRNYALNLDVLGSSGLKEFSGVIDEEFHPKLKGRYGLNVYREMSDNSSTIGAIQVVIDSLIRQVEWRVEESDTDNPTSIEWATFLEECQGDMETSFEDFISEVLSMLVYGWAYFEIIYKIRRENQSDYNDGRIGWNDIALRGQDTLDHWVFDKENRKLLGMQQEDYYSGVSAFLPIEKCAHFTTKKYKDNPEGRSFYRNAVVDYFYLKRISQIEAVGIERDLVGLPIMEVPLGILSTTANPAQLALRAQFEKMLAEIKNDERAYALVPPELDGEGKPTGYKFKLLSAGGSRAFSTNDIKKYYKTNILQTALAQFLELGMQGVGSFALASSQTNLFSVALGSILDNISSTINKQLVKPLMRLNGCPVDLIPYFVHGDIEAPPLDEIAAYITALAGAGQLPEDDKIKRKLLEFAELPVPDPDEDLIVETETEMKAPTKGVSKRKIFNIKG